MALRRVCFSPQRGDTPHPQGHMEERQEEGQLWQET